MRRALLAASLAALISPAAADASFTQEPGSPFDTLGSAPYAVLAADFNADGRPDVAASNGDSGTVAMLLRQPGGGFAHETGSPFGVGMGAAGGSYAAIADFNADSRPDIGVANYATSNVSILLRNSGSGFTLEQNPPLSAPRPGAIAVADFNADGRPDIAAPDLDSGGVTILLRNTGSGFTAAGKPGTGTTPRYVAAADFNGDGDPDLAIPNLGSNNVTVLLGGPGGSFTQEPGSPIGVGLMPQVAVAHDANGDGRPDLAVTNYNSDTVTLLIRQPGGGFAEAPGSPLSVGNGPIGMATGDFNFDGLPDFVVAHSIESSVSVLLRNVGGDYTLDGGARVPTDRGANAVAVADFDADGRSDLAVSNIGRNTVSILLNTTPFPPGAPPPPPPNLDADGDGVQRPFDCDDADASIRPGAVDKPGDGIDQDCIAGDAPFPLLNRRVVAFLDTYPTQRYSVFTSIVVKPARIGDRLRLTCRGRGCPFGKKKVRVKKDARSISLLRHLGGAKLRKGAVVRLRVTRPGTVGRVWTWKVRAPKRVRITPRCVQPGATKLSACPDA